MGEVGQDGATALVRQAFDAGVNFIDTANVYSLGMSETLTGEAIRTLGLPRDELVIATKATGIMAEGSPNGRGQSRYQPDERGRREPEAAAGRSHRSLPAARLRSADAARRRAVDAERPRSLGQGALHRPVQHGRVADHEGARDLGPQRVGALRERTGVLHDRRSRSRTRGAAAGARPAARRDGVEPARGRTAERQVQRRRQGPRRHASRELRLPGGGQAARVPLRRRDAADRGSARRVGRARRARVAAEPPGGEHGDRRREDAGPAGGQPRGHRPRAVARGPGRARSGQRAAVRISGLDAEDAGPLSRRGAPRRASPSSRGSPCGPRESARAASRGRPRRLRATRRSRRTASATACPSRRCRGSNPSPR